MTESGPESDQPCEASNGGHGGTGGQRQGHPGQGAKTPTDRQSGLLPPPVACRTAG
jgi:hypothetical protein